MGGARGPAALARSRQVIAPVAADAVEDPVESVDLRIMAPHATYHGYEGVRRWMAEIDHQFDDWNVSIDEFRDASEGRLLALGTVHVRGRTNGVAFEQPMALLLAFAEGRLIELRTIPDHAQGLEAAGLRE
jgi:ketosteroid isomerase-like protein